MSEAYEKRLLREAETLENLVAIFSHLESYLGTTQEINQDILDDTLLKALSSLQVELAYLVGAKELTFRHEGKKYKIQGLCAQLDEVLENIRVFQAGLPAKGERDANSDSV